MTSFAQAMLILFIAAWFVSLAGWLYGTRFFLPIWAKGFRKVDRHKGYARKAALGYAVFVSAIIFGFAIGGLAQLAGGWQ
ncbi:hypothetical protein ACN2C7_02820 [Caulobacter sp. ErkDOM-E]|uniref:hypothetical protein n=1 Tax=Caulobacter sp. ErkDOM-E TaxID=3402778 RepID=UPI003AF521B4